MIAGADRVSKASIGSICRGREHSRVPIAAVPSRVSDEQILGKPSPSSSFGCVRSGRVYSALVGSQAEGPRERQRPALSSGDEPGRLDIPFLTGARSSASMDPA